MTEQQQLISSLDLFRRLPIENIKKNLELISPLILNEEILDELLNSIDSNLLIKIDNNNLINDGREFLVSFFVTFLFNFSFIDRFQVKLEFN